MSNENKPSLSKYFGEPETQAGSVFFDEIGTSPLTEQSLSADNHEELLQTVSTSQQTIQSPPTMNIFGTNGHNDLSVSYSTKSNSQQSYPSATADFTIPSAVPNSSTPMAAKHLPDPSKFFDMIGPGGQGGSAASVLSTEYINKSLEDLSIKDNQGNDVEANRRRDAWIPDENGQKVLLQAQTSPNGSFFPERDVLTMPGIKLEEELPDALQEVAIRYLGVGEAASRGVLRAEHVTRDENGVRELIRTGYFRAAINLTGTLITAYGQGLGRSGRPTKHSPRSLQLWFTRFALFARIKLHTTLEQEAEAFGNLNKPDMYFQFYPENYGNRSGSMVPFSFRLLVAEVPLHMSKPEEALSRLYKLLDVIRNIIKNLKSGRTEDGTCELPNQQDKLESMKLWSGREARLLHSVVNCALVLKDYRLALQVMVGLASSPHWPAAHVRALRSAMGRVCLQAGHVEGAREHFEVAGEMRHSLCPMPDMREYVDKGLLCIAQSMYPEAFENFVKAAEIEPTNIMVANNTAVCLLYMGKLKQAITVLQNTISQSPARGLDESLLLNLCTLHELECSSAADRKLSLLRALCKYRSDTIPSVAECLKLA